jgi:hypothetical protein
LSAFFFLDKNQKKNHAEQQIIASAPPHTQLVPDLTAGNCTKNGSDLSTPNKPRRKNGWFFFFLRGNPFRGNTGICSEMQKITTGFF